jgi:hypothetical protein
LTIGYKRLIEGSRVFVENESRDAMYKVATYLVSQFWGKPRDITDGLGVLLLTWNQALYRYGSFDFDLLERSLNEKMETLGQFREREIFSFSEKDANITKTLFNEFLIALQDAKGRRSPVAVSKTLHLLAPGFFPLWDNKIAKAYGCSWYYSDEACDRYLKFMRKMQDFAENVVQSFMSIEGVHQEIAVKMICEKCSRNLPFTKSLLKIIDEYNFAKYTKKWIK